MKKNLTGLGERLKFIRGNDSQPTFCKKIGLPQSSYSDWERDLKTPSASAVFLICSACSVSADWLLGLSDTRHTTAAAPQPQPATPQPPPPDTRWFDLVASQQATIATLTQALAAPKPAPAAPAGGTTATKTA